MTSARPVVEMRAITVRYPGQVALDEVDLRLRGGEVHSLMGENGAGKSTLLKVLTGSLRADGGTVSIDGRPLVLASPADARRAGISVVHQELHLLPNLSVAENVLLGREPRCWRGIDWAALRARARDALAALGVHVDPASPLREHGPAVRQLVAIARALDGRPRVLVLDEPTSSLDADEVAGLFRTIRGLRDSGVAVVFVSHFLEQVYEIADRLTVLRDGRLVGEFTPREVLRRDLVGKMLGHDLDDLDDLALVGERRRDDDGDDGDDGRPLLTARSVGRARDLRPFDLDVLEGEVVGFAGLLGSGRSEVARAISGIDPIDTGSVKVDGQRLRPGAPRTAMARRVVYSSEDRRERGIIADLSVGDNILLALQAQRGWFRRLSRARQEELVGSYIEALHIHPADPGTRAGSLSGGNQQKVLLARWLALAPRLLVLDEPTRGIDVGAKVEIQRLVGSLVENGLSLVYISSEIDEVLRVSDRVVVMRDHQLVAVLPTGLLEREDLLSIIAEGRAGAPERRA